MDLHTFYDRILKMLFNFGVLDRGRRIQGIMRKCIGLYDDYCPETAQLKLDSRAEVSVGEINRKK
ncbi:hypothetical protein RSJ42_07980 [Methanosarcina hadiensis]|uniref:hypothetical protein n=1 Tax=Methanosarcina hadiensis TaxID=3078083 RepID=UPI0039778220